MRASISIAASLTIGVMAACSNPASETASSRDSSFESELELAIFPNGARVDDSRAVVSEMEIIKPAPVPGAVAVREVSTPTPLPDAEPTIALVDPQGIRAPTVRDAPTIQPVVLAGVERSEGRATAPASDGGSVRGVIIRGGVDERRDPCVIHGPGGVAGTLGGIGVLINDPTPRGVGIGARGGTGAVIGGSPRGGVMFAGGIR